MSCTQIKPSGFQAMHTGRIGVASHTACDCRLERNLSETNSTPPSLLQGQAHPVSEALFQVNNYNPALPVPSYMTSGRAIGPQHRAGAAPARAP